MFFEALVKFLPHGFIHFLVQSEGIAVCASLNGNTNFDKAIGMSSDDSHCACLSPGRIPRNVLLDMKLEWLLLTVQCRRWIFSDILTGKDVCLNVKYICRHGG